MHPFPHHYTVEAAARPAGAVRVSAAGLPALDTAPPVEFDGPGDQWSPETLLCAAVADCFVLSFRAVARASKFDWSTLECSVRGKLDRVEGRTSFTEIDIDATLHVAPGTDTERATKLLEKSEHVCLVSNSLAGRRRLNPTVVVD